jgi:hypothetical protein
MASSNNNFEIEKPSTGYVISGIQVQSGTPIAGQLLVYDGPTNQWKYTNPPGLFAGIPVQSGMPTNGQTLKYDQTANEWKFSN